MKKKGAYKWITLAVLLVIIAGLIITAVSKKEDTKDPGKEKENKSESTYRPVYHFSTPDKWKNDPQKPIYFDGKYHYYYLYNHDYPKGNGTEWRHATSKDLVHWKDEGIAIRKYTNKNGDIWSGSVVEDKDNTAGFGKDAIVAIMTQPSADGQKQEQYLWYSTDRGKTFKSYSKNPIMPNPGTKDFRDPKVIWDNEHDKWVLVMSEGEKIGFYESSNLKDWTYTGGFVTKDIGITECPDLFQMKADDGTVKWVLGTSANGKESGKPNTYAYWTGNYDGTTFTPDMDEPQWLDHGFDWYGGVTFEDGKNKDSLEKRYAFAWMNNWDYPDKTPMMKEGFNGFDSVTREITLSKQDDDQYSLLSKPVEELNQLTDSTNSVEQVEVNGEKKLKIKGETYQLDTDISWSDAENVGLRLRESADQKRHIDVGIFAKDNVSYVNRSYSNQPDQSKKYVESRDYFNAGKKNVHLKILVDKTSIEVFVDDGKTVHSSEVFPRHNDQGITLFSQGGTSLFKNIEIKHLRSLQ
ncbi:glycoside hydrolase family 32 protein [Priestia megaterium]|uniref:glycoside hydrolase family 32 protein n=1 Tax=Priestia megaterium TaxID=1404 RepID=UPI001C8E5507|nr:glycoside hydrolase family 32 protein [Priestia megaterium]MBY0199707.1 glycoside hydrolase family 32 protein [Priestia megaterium]